MESLEKEDLNITGTLEYINLERIVYICTKKINNV